MSFSTSSKVLNKLHKSVIARGQEWEQECLTPPASATIIATLCAVEAEENRQARQIACLQAAAALMVSGVVYSLNGVQQYAAAVLSGGLVSTLNGTLLAWRMSRAALPSALEAQHSSGAHRQLRLMYFYAAERFVVVVVLLCLCLAVMKLSPLAVLGGFVMGQAALLAARLFLNRLNQNLD